MKLVIVNDCANVMADLQPYLSRDVQFVKRNRGFFSKTFGLLYNIAKQNNGSLFHVNYGLQDAWLVSKLKHLDVLHLHGGEIRWGLKGKWRWVVEANLKAAKRVLYATPDMATVVLGYRQDAVYLPTPIDLNQFQQQPQHTGMMNCLYIPKPYETFPSHIKRLIHHNHGKVTILHKKFPHNYMPTVYGRFNVFIDQQTIPAHSRSCLEAMSCGLATIDFRHQENLEEHIEQLADPKIRIEHGFMNRNYVQRNHDIRNVAVKLLRVYDGCA